MTLYYPFFLLLMLMLFSTPQFTTSTPPRRALHEPFFPAAAPPPSFSPENSHPSPPPFPKYSSTTTTPEPFFPSYSSPPSPPSSQNTPSSYPANISSLIFPNSNSAPPPTHRSSGKLVASVLLPLLALTFIGVAVAFFMFKDHRRRKAFRPDKSVRSDSHRLFPVHSTPSDDSVPQPPHSEYLYVGTMVSSGGKLAGGGSPELRPLPPLSSEFPLSKKQSESESDSEEYYSPRLSESRNSRQTFRADESADVDRCGSCSSMVSTPSYPSSGSPPPPAAPSTGPSTAKTLSSRSNGFVVAEEEVNNGFTTAAPPPPPPPPTMRPLTPSPPQRRPPSSPPLDLSGSNSPPSMRMNEFQKNLPPVRQAPPLPPPPPPAGYWESHIRNLSARQPQILTQPRSPPGFKDSAGSAVEVRLVDGNEGNEETTPRPKLKTLHWDKVRASSDREMVWDQLKSSSFQVNEEMIETLFCKPISIAPNEIQKKQVLPSPKLEGGVLDPKKSHNIAILLRALNVTKEEVCEALAEGNTNDLGTELLETLLKMAPTKEEELKLRDYKDGSPFKLGTAEKFLKAILDIPFAFKRVDAMLYIANFESEVDYLKKSFETLELACEELRSSRLFLKLLEAVLKTGNRMNVGTNRGDARAFKLDTLLKLVDVKGTDGKTTLLHFVVQEIIRAEGSRLSASNPALVKTQANILHDDLEHKKLGLQVVSGLGAELTNVKKAAAMDSDVLSSYVSKLAGGIMKIHEVLRLNNTNASKDGGICFQETMDKFLKRAEDEIFKIQAHESVALSLVKEITEYFHGNSAKEEAHPFRIFMVVRDFLSILGQVCNEVGKFNERTFLSSARQFPVPVNPTLPQIFPRVHALRPDSSDDESSLSSSEKPGFSVS